MKPPLIQRLKSRLLLSGHKKQQGVAILTVLAIITLMTVLVISFFNMAQSAQSTAKGSVEVQRVTTLKDTIINLVIAQFREASALAPSDTSKPRDIITWTSQPGGIRTYSGTEVSKNKLYKLYSSSEPQIGGIAAGETAAYLRQVNNDNEPTWSERPDEWADLNRPVYTSATGDRASATGASDREGFSYPIADPRAYNGSDSNLTVNTEGFRYDSQALQKRMRGVDAKSGQLAMPVRWIYILEDGTLGYLKETGEFTNLSGSEGSEPSGQNPIVGRMAWWADDESCKINVNTASVPSIWDTPRTTSKEDRWLAKSQPLACEYQRYPGHPATVDLSAVFFPGRRYVPENGDWKMPIGNSMNAALSQEQADLIWDLAPFINSGGTAGGTRKTPDGATADFAKDDHLFTSLDEMYFKAGGGTSKSLNNARDNLESLGRDSKGELLQRLERGQFFLTHKSHSPELTLQGFPRVSMYPMADSAAPFVGKDSTNQLPNTVSPYDVTMGVNSTIGGKIYYLQRSDPTSRHAELYDYNSGRNVALFGYLKELSKLPIPGYPDGYAGAMPINYSPALPDDPTGFSLGAKYPAGYNGKNGRYTDSTQRPKFGFALLDASDRTQILLNMVDYSRSLNMQPAFIDQSRRYDGGNGQSSGFCGCGSVGAHNDALKIGQLYRVPKAAGKILVPAEITMVVNVATVLPSGAAVASNQIANGLRGQMTARSPSATIADDKDSAGFRFFVEVGFIVSGFNPKHGWAPVQPNSSIFVTTGYPGDPVSTTAFNPANPASTGNVLPMYANLGDGQTEYLHMPTSLDWAGGGSGNSANPSPARGVPANIIPYGGMQGPRAYMVNPKTQGSQGAGLFAMCAPLCYRTTEAGPLKVDLTVDPSLLLRIMTTDGVASQGNVTAAVDLQLPTNLVRGINLQVSNTSLRAKAIEYNKGTLKFPDPKCATRSFVLPSGDYRLVTGLRTESDMFVVHQNYANNGTSMYEANSVPAARKLSTPGNYSSQTLINGSAKPDIPDYITPQSSSPMSSLPLPLADNDDMDDKTGTFLTGANTTNGLTTPVKKVDDPELLAHASMDPTRRKTFAFGRRDGHGFVPKRGSSDPDETGDFDNGVAAAEDGPYMNYPDEGDRRGKDTEKSYFDPKLMLNMLAAGNADGKAAQNISPNFLLRSPVDFGSIPSGIQARVPWQTLRFRPDPGMNKPELTIRDLRTNPPDGMPFANFCGPRDHFFLDMFWMPVVEPWAISEPFSTKGTINLNQQILPFLYIERTTALHALFRGERILAIPNEAAARYKRVNPDGTPNNVDDGYRYFLNAKETVRQFNTRYNDGLDMEDQKLAFNTFRSASEICEVWLVPDKNGYDADGGQEWDLKYIIGGIDNNKIRHGFWPDHRLTGDNARERPYANLYPRVTVRSNVFKLHMVAQTLQKARSQDPKTFDSTKDSVTAEWRGSCLIERSADSLDRALTKYDYANLDSRSMKDTVTPRIDRYYTYRVTEVKQLTQ